MDTSTEEKDILVAPVRSTAEALVDPQLVVNKMLVAVDHAQVGATWHVWHLRLSETLARQARPAPLLGDDSARVLCEWVAGQRNRIACSRGYYRLIGRIAALV